MEKEEILTYEDIKKIKLTSEGFFLNGEALKECCIKLEEFTFIDKYNKEQTADYLYYMYGEGLVITAKDSNMRNYIGLYDFLENEKVEYKDSSRLKLEEELKIKETEKDKEIEYRNKLENYKRPKQKLKIEEMRETILEEDKYKQLKYQIILYEEYHAPDEYYLKIETKNQTFSKVFFSIEELRKKQQDILEKYSQLPEDIGIIFDLYISHYLDTNIVIVEDIKEYQDILKYNNKKYNTTFTIREELTKLKFKWKPERRNWQLEVNTEKERKELIDSLIEKYQNNYKEKELKGINHCWECGGAFYKKHACR